MVSEERIVKKIRYQIVLAVTLVLALFAIPAQASIVPRTLSYQGYLTLPDGTPLTAPVNMTFALYAAATGGTPLWSELHSNVPISNGVYSLVLGDTTPVNLPFDVPYFLGTTIGADPEMTPRQPLNSVPFALRAGCNSGDMISCYTGDLATLGLGLVRAGVRTCSADGTGYGACTGQVLPETPASIAITSSSSTQVINGPPISIRASITSALGSAAADGTPVTFFATAGTLNSTSALTLAGTAQVSLSGITTPKTVTVFASAGGITTPVSVDVTFVSPVTLSVSPSAPVSASLATPVTISANVLKGTGGAVADGSTVTFTTTFGTLSANSAVTTGGVASVTLTSFTAGSGTVTASSNLTSSSSALISFVDPNKPGAVALVASSPSGTTSAGGGVTLTATVSPVSPSGTVANGTVVTFNIGSGSGALTAVTTTIGGVATATLSSSTVNAVSVSATAGTVTSSPVSVSFIAQPTLAIVKLGTSGTLPAGQIIGGITAGLLYPLSGLSIAAADISGTGTGFGSFLIPNTNVVGTANLALITAAGIQVGEFATLNFHVAPGSFPKAADFSIAVGASIIDATSTLAIPGLNVQVLSVTLQ
jgi:hypothetical protein